MNTVEKILGFLHSRLQYKRIASVVAFLCLAASGATYKVDIDRSSGIYRCGEKATFTVRLLSTGNLASNGPAYAQLDNFGTSVLTNLPFSVDSTGVAFTVSGTLEKPGFLRLSLPRTRNGRYDPYVFSVGFEPERIVKGSPSPVDFDAYWASERARLSREVPLDPQVVRVPERCTADFDYYRISFATFGRRVHGYMSIPTDRSQAPFPVDFGVNAAGFGGWTNDMGGSKDSIRVQFSVYPFPPDWKWKEIGLEAKYKKMNAELKSKYGANNYRHAGIAESREAYFFHPVLLGIDRAVDWLAARPDVDRSRFRYQGTSQGGGFGFYLCGLNRAFTRAAFYVPAITDTMGYLKGRESGWPKIVENNSATHAGRLAAERWAPYFDGANFASRITCPVRVAVGFSDETCPPCAVYAAYNEIKSADKGIVNGIGMTHSCSRQFYRELGDWVVQSK
jgi:cephalosporin-C deacetylase-like acetyl esterase